MILNLCVCSTLLHNGVCVVLVGLFGSDYREYRHCTRETRAECKRGVELMYEQDGKLRSMMLKLEYICKESKAGE